MVHAVAEPIVFDAPRAFARSVRVAYQTARPISERIYEGRSVDEVDDPEPTRVAYFVRQPERAQNPQAEPATAIEDGSDDDDALHNAQAEEQLTGVAHPIVSGERAVLRSGVAYAPANAPARVKNAIWATNTLRRKPYVWGGGHRSFDDRGYDCSGTVSFALHHAGTLAAPMPSSDLMRFGERGRGRWITIYTRPGHTFAVIAGLRLDTTDFYSGGNVGPRWHTDMRETFGYVARHPAGL